jgi:DNA repair protein RadC
VSPDYEDETITLALSILAGRLREPGEAMSNPETVKNFLRLKLQEREHEIFACLFLDNRHRLIEYKELFRGTIDGASVYPREVVKEALSVNAAAVILAHNHPSGLAEPSQADIRITRRLTNALGLIDIRVLDHVVVGHERVSMAERGVI